MTPADAARLAEIRDWQPIATLPAMKRAFVGCWYRDADPPFWQRAEGHWFMFQGKREWSLLGELYGEPTHWILLPPPPEIPHSDAGGSPGDSAQGEDR